MIIILFGAPGSGKGTQAKEISEYFNIRRISLGDILREEVKRKSSLGSQVKQFMEKGVLVPDSIVGEVVKNNIPEGGFVLDGYPRNINQAKYLDEVLLQRKKKIDTALYLDVDEPTVLKRLEFRRVCRNCSANYHLINMPPKVEGVCDVCGGELIQRKDDTPSVIKERLKVFLSESRPLLQFYKDKGVLINIDARDEKDEVFSRIRKAIEDGRYIKQ